MIQTEHASDARTPAEIAEVIVVATSELNLSAEAQQFVENLHGLLVQHGLADVVGLSLSKNPLYSEMSTEKHLLMYKNLTVLLLGAYQIDCLAIAINKRLDGVAHRAVDPTKYTPEQYLKHIILERVRAVSTILQRHMDAAGGKYIFENDEVTLVSAIPYARSSQQDRIVVSQATGLNIVHGPVRMRNNSGEEFIVDYGMEKEVFQSLFGWRVISS